MPSAPQSAAPQPMEMEMTDSTCTTVHEERIATPFGVVGHAVAGVVRYFRREREIARAVRQLAAMPDHMLKDMGIDRHEIEYAARFGRREYGRRFL